MKQSHWHLQFTCHRRLLASQSVKLESIVHLLQVMILTSQDLLKKVDILLLIGFHHLLCNIILRLLICSPILHLPKCRHAILMQTTSFLIQELVFPCHTILMTGNTKSKFSRLQLLHNSITRPGITNKQTTIRTTASAKFDIFQMKF